MISQVVGHFGSVAGMSVADIGCNAGYFSVSFAQAGAAQTVGYDRIDYTETLGLMNDICGTTSQFKLQDYNGEPESEDKHDLVLSIAVLVHMSEPLRHLAWLGSAAKKTLFVMTPCHREDDYYIRFHTVNRYYSTGFANCFNTVTVSRKFLHLAFEQMGF